MPRYNIWIRNEDKEKWLAIKDRPQWIHEQLTTQQAVKLDDFSRAMHLGGYLTGDEWLERFIHELHNRSIMKPEDQIYASTALNAAERASKLN